jgi:hypothetical protein
MKWALLAVAAAACAEPSSGPRVDGATPPYGPLAGGTAIEVTGAGFSTATRVSVAGREAPLVRVIDDRTLGVVVPPGERAGDAELVVFDGTTSTAARGLFHYSALPTLVAAEPGEVVSTEATEMTVTGSGFLDEGAGTAFVFVDGLFANVRVISDTTLAFTTWPGPPLARATIHLTNARGTATLARAFRYRPSAHDGLLLFPATEDALADLFDPTDNSLVTIPYVTPLPSRYTAVVRDGAGDYLVLDRGQRFGRLDPSTTTIEHPRQASTLLPTIVAAYGGYYAIDRIGLRIGLFDPATGAFTPLDADPVPCCGSYGLAFDGTTLYMAARSTTGGGVTITPVSPAGELGTPVPIVASSQFHVEEMRFFRGVLYAASRDGTLVTIDPATGATTALPLPSQRYKAMEVFD